MQVELSIHFFTSALAPTAIPDISSDSAYRVDLVVEGSEAPLPIELVDSWSADDGTDNVVAVGYTANPNLDYSSLSEGIDFYMMVSGKMAGKGRVLGFRF